jgi:hypothetical protein
VFRRKKKRNTRQGCAEKTEAQICTDLGVVKKLRKNKGKTGVNSTISYFGLIPNQNFRSGRWGNKNCAAGDGKRVDAPETYIQRIGFKLNHRDNIYSRPD